MPYFNILRLNKVKIKKSSASNRCRFRNRNKFGRFRLRIEHLIKKFFKKTSEGRKYDMPDLNHRREKNNNIFNFIFIWLKTISTLTSTTTRHRQLTSTSRIKEY